MLWEEKLKNNPKKNCCVTVTDLPHQAAVTVCPNKTHGNLEVGHKSPEMSLVRHSGADIFRTPSVTTDVYVQDK